jgi:hypothetical protein
MRLCLHSLSILLVASTILAGAEGLPPSTWAQIRERAEPIASKNLPAQALRAALAEEARRIVAQRGAAVIGELAQGAGDRQRAMAPDHPELVMAAYVLALASDPENNSGLLAWPEEVVTWETIVTLIVVAVDLSPTPKSGQLLCGIGLEDAYSRRLLPDGSGHRLWRDPAALALGLLRAHDDGTLRPVIEAALLAERAKPQPASIPTSTESRGDYLAAFLASADYAAKLDREGAAGRYREFERRLWRAWAMLRGNPITPRWFLLQTAQVVGRQLQPGDERFIVRIFEEDAVTITEMMVAVYLADQLPRDALERLAQIAASESSKAPFARQALDLAARAGRQLPTTQPSTRPEDRP